MSYLYASSLFRTATAAATRCAFDYLTACGNASAGQAFRFAAMSDAKLEKVLKAAANDGWTIASDSDDDADPFPSFKSSQSSEPWDSSDVDFDDLRSELRAYVNNN